MLKQIRMVSTEKEICYYESASVKLAQFLFATRSSKLQNKKSTFSILINNFVESGASINYQIPKNPKAIFNGTDLTGFTLLHIAALEHNLEAIDILLTYGADFTIKNGCSNTPLHTASRELIDCSNHQIHESDKMRAVINSILSAHISTENYFNPTNKWGVSHFHISCISNNVEAVKFFLEGGVSINDVIEKSGYTPLHLTVKSGSVEITKLLLKYGADQNVGDCKGRTPLYISIEEMEKFVKITNTGEKVKKGIDVNKYQRIIELLLRNKDKNLSQIHNDTGLTEFHIACMLQDKSVAEEYLKQNVATNMSVRNDSPIFPGFTPLHFAAYFNLEIMKLLLQNKVNSSVKDGNGLLPLSLSSRIYPFADIISIIKSQTDLNNMLLSDGSIKLLDLVLALETYTKFSTFMFKISNLNITVPQKSQLWPGYTLLHLAIILPVEYGQSVDERKVQILLRGGANSISKAADGLTPIHLAFRLKDESIMSELFNALKRRKIDKIKMETPPDPNNLSLFQIACVIQHGYAIQKSIQIGVNVNIPVESDLGWFSSHFGTSGLTPLHLAVINKNLKEVKLLLDHGADPNTKDALGLTPVHRALVKKHRKKMVITNLLLAQNLKNCISKEGLSHLHVACSANNVEAVKTLLSLGADINGVIKCGEISDKVSSKQIEQLLRNADGLTPLQIAVNNNCNEVVDILLQYKANIDVKNSRSWSTLLAHDANQQACNNNLSSVYRLKDTDEEGDFTLLHFACAIADENLVFKLLNDGVHNVNAQTNWNDKVSEIDHHCGYTALHFVIRAAKDRNRRNVCKNIVKILLKHDADVTIKSSEEGTPIHLAYKIMCLERFDDTIFEIINTMLSKQSYKINPIDSDGFSHLHIAILQRNILVIKEFLKYGYNVEQNIHPFALRTPGFTLLHCAVYANSEEAAEILLEYGANVRAVDSNRNTALHIAAKQNSLSQNIVKKLVTLGADINARNIFGETPLLILLQLEQFSKDDIELFLHHGSKVNVYNYIASEGLLAISAISGPQRNAENTFYSPTDIMIKSCNINEIGDNGMNAIHNIVSINHRKFPDLNVLTSGIYVQFLESLIQIGLDINHQDEQGRTPLHTAMNFENIRAVTALLWLGADVNITDKQGHSSLFYAFRKNCQDVLFVLHEHYLKMMYIELYISQSDRILLLQAGRRFVYAPKIQNFKDEFDKMKGEKITSLFSVQDFSTELSSVIIRYPRLSLVNRKELDRIFQASQELRNKFPELACFLMLQYRKAQSRVGLVEPVINFLNELGLKLPILCLVRVTDYLNTDELKFFYEHIQDDH